MNKYLTNQTPYPIVRTSLFGKETYMITATVTSKGQITIPKDIRDQLKIQAGDRIHFFIDNSTGTVTFLPVKTNVRELKGIVPKPQKPISISDMNEAIQAGGSKI